MSQKNNLPMIIGAVALLVIAGGSAFYFSKNMTNEAPATTAETASATQPAASSAASGEPAATPQEENEAAQSAQASFDGVDVKPGNPVVAKVDGQDITRVDVYRFIKLMPANVQQLPPQAVYPLALEQVVNTRLVQNKAEAAGLENDPEVREQLDMARQQIIRSVYVQRELDKRISDSEVKAKYNDAIGKTPAIEEINASHILVDNEAAAKDIIAKLEAGGDFAKLAAENSGDPGNKDKGGELGWFSKTDMVPAFSDGAFKLGKGEVTKAPIKTQFGWHVVKVTDKRERPKPTLDETRPMIEAELRREKLETILDDWRKTAKIEKFDINGDKVQEHEAVAPAAGEQPAAEAPAPAAAE